MSSPLQLSALLGVIIGAGSSYLTTGALERSRWKRQRASRWDDRLLAAYADYALAVKDTVNLCIRLAAGRGLSEHSDPLDGSDESLALLTSADVRRSALLETLRLLSDSDTMSAVVEMNDCLWHLNWLARGRAEGDATLWESTATKFDALRNEFNRCARRSLAIPGVAEARSRSWPPSWWTDEA